MTQRASERNFKSKRQTFVYENVDRFEKDFPIFTAFHNKIDKNRAIINKWFVKDFFNFRKAFTLDNPQLHGHKAKSVNSSDIQVKLNQIFIYI